MAKRRIQQESQLSSGATLAILSIGGLLVVALVVWALTRSVERAPVATTATSVSDVPQVAAGDTAATPAASRTIGEEQSVEKKAVPRMAVEDLKAKLDRGAVTVIDVRDAGSYASGHIPGSLHIPLAAVEGAAATLPKDKPIVTYCT